MQKKNELVMPEKSRSLMETEAENVVGGEKGLESALKDWLISLFAPKDKDNN